VSEETLMIRKRNLDTNLINWIQQTAGGGLDPIGTAQLLGARREAGTTQSKTYYVDKDGNDSWSGLEPDRPFLTIDKAIDISAARINWSNTPWARQDTIIVYPGEYAENLTSAWHGCSLVGLGHDVRDAQFGVKVKPASGDPVDFASLINASCFNMGFEVGTGEAFDCTIINNCLFENCFFTGAAETATAAAALVGSDMTKSTWRNCWFCNADKGFDINYVDANDKFAYVLFENCWFTGIDTAGMEVSSNLVGPHTMVNRCYFLGAGQTMAIGISDSSGIVDVNGSYFDCTDAVNGVNSVNGCYASNALTT
jgi:hypothetical protein